jgi:hypothetical protein
MKLTKLPIVLTNTGVGHEMNAVRNKLRLGMIFLGTLGLGVLMAALALQNMPLFHGAGKLLSWSPLLYLIFILFVAENNLLDRFRREPKQRQRFNAQEVVLFVLVAGIVLVIALGNLYWGSKLAIG